MLKLTVLEGGEDKALPTPPRPSSGHPLYTDCVLCKRTEPNHLEHCIIADSATIEWPSTACKCEWVASDNSIGRGWLLPCDDSSCGRDTGGSDVDRGRGSCDNG